MHALALVLLLQTPEAPTQEAEETPPAPVEEVTLTFDWPATGSVRVDQRHTAENGETARSRFLLFWSPNEAQRGTVVQHTEYEFLGVGQRDMDDPGFRQEAQMFRWLQSSLPEMYVGPDGQVLGFGSWAKTVRDTLAYMRETGATEEQVGYMEETFEQPGYSTATQQNLAQLWHVWVGAFNGQTYPVGEMQETEISQPVPRTEKKIRVQQRIKVEEVAAPGKPRRVRVRLQNLTDPESLKAALLSIGEANVGMQPLEARDEIEGVFEVETLRPLYVRTMTLARWDTVQAPIEQRETREYTFNWTDLQ